jgi:hypothetical protein
MILRVLPEPLVVARLAPDHPLPAPGIGFWSVTRTHEELSLVCTLESLPTGALHEGPFRAFMVQGPLDFSLVGILSSLSGSLAKAGVSLFALSTFDTDYLLVRSEQLEAARGAFAADGHEILES